jgi:L-lactate utilization protein LutB
MGSSREFVNIFKTLCIIKRRQLELLDEAIKKRRELIANRKGRKLYANQDIEAFRKIEQQIKEEKGNIKKHWEFAVKGFFPIFG